MKLLLTIFTVLVCTSGYASAQKVTSAQISIGAKEISTSKSDDQMKINVDITLNKNPNRDCKVALSATISTIGDPSDDTRRFKLGTANLQKGAGKKMTFQYKGPALSGTTEKQSQANFQVQVNCGKENPIFTNVDATNVTCTEGVSRQELITAFRKNSKRIK